MRGVRFLTCCLIVLSMFVELAMGSSKVWLFTWKVKRIAWSPDGVKGVVLAINDHFPGPTIRARAGDTLAINVTNGLDGEGLSIHWHGIRQFGTPWADGTAAISQCAIKPGETFLYKFTVDKPGTFFYHGHHGMQRTGGLYGSLIVDVADGEREKFQYDAELNLLLSDWWHKESRQQEVDLSNKPFRWMGEPQSLLINGRGQFNCSLAAHVSNSQATPCNLTGNEQYAPSILQVQPNKVYRLRIASTTSLASLNFAIGNHTMQVVEADGNYVVPFNVTNMDIYSGESYSVLITTDQDPTPSYWVSAAVRGRQPNTSQALTLLTYTTQTPNPLPTWAPSTPPLWNDYAYSKSFAAKLRALTGPPKPPTGRPTRRIYLLNTQNLIDGYTKWAINNVSLVLPSTPFLGSVKRNLRLPKRPPGSFSNSYDVTTPAPNPNATYGGGAYEFQLNAIVDVILQNANALKANVSEIHPWHLHGHDFWVLGYGDGRFKNGRDESRLNLENPPLKNTAVIFPFGWMALRFLADNPGIWAFHCHIEPHLHMGMGVVFAEGTSAIRKMNIPEEALRC